MGIEDLIVRLRIEEDNRNYEKKLENSSGSKANIIKDGHKANKKRKPVGHEQSNKKRAKKFQGNCYVHYKPDHRAIDCHNHKGNIKKKTMQIHMTEEDTISNDISDLNL